MITIERVPLQANPHLFDLVFADLQQALAAGLPWLDHAFGRAERLVKMIESKRYYTPNVYVGGNEYREVSPDSGLGNFSFFTLDDPQTMLWARYRPGTLRSTYSLIVWVDMRRIPLSGEGRNIEAVKAQILQAINVPIRHGSISVEKIYERAENIYKGFTLDEVSNQFLMQPYAGYRFEGEMSVNEPCQ